MVGCPQGKDPQHSLLQWRSRKSTVSSPSWGLLFDNSDSVSQPDIYPTNRLFHLNWPTFISLATKISFPHYKQSQMCLAFDRPFSPLCCY